MLVGGRPLYNNNIYIEYKRLERKGLIYGGRHKVERKKDKEDVELYGTRRRRTDNHSLS